MIKYTELNIIKFMSIKLIFVINNILINIINIFRFSFNYNELELY